MHKQVCRCVMVLLLAFAPARLRAQTTEPATFDASHLQRVADIGDGTWRVHAGDDPRWARADFDDSTWPAFSTEGELRSVLGNAQPSVVWYRLHVKVSPNDRNLALAQNNVAAAFEVYSNGVLIMRAGRVAPFSGVTAFYTQSPIPERQIATGSVVVAVRIALSKHDWQDSRPGIGPSNILLGYGLQLGDRRHYRVLIASVTEWFTAGLGILVGLIALGLYLVQKERREYLWAFLFGFSTALDLSINLFRAYYAIPLLPFDVITGVLNSLPAIAAVRFVWGALGRRAGRWIHLYQIIMLLVPPLLYVGFDEGWLNYRSLVFATLPLSLPLNLMLPIVTAREGRRGNREAWLLLIPLLIGGFDTYLNYVAYIFAGFSIKSERLDSAIASANNMAVGSLRLSLGTATTAIALCSIALIIVLRTNRISRQLSHAAAELEAARGVQSLLLSRESMATPGFAVESVYQPAQEVGGDFFLVSPGADGSLLVVVGDVSGKGLPAALRVSLILGALQREPSRHPAEVLAGLNKVLYAQRDGGFTTCGCALLASDGALTLANAGHLSPYRDGEELAVDGGLPLGIIEDATYEETPYTLQPSETLVFLSDGVVEARNADGELLGFSHVQQISRQSAAEIASTAQRFGQDDDITVVRVTRLAVPVLA